MVSRVIPCADAAGPYADLPNPVLFIGSHDRKNPDRNLWSGAKFYIRGCYEKVREHFYEKAMVALGKLRFSRDDHRLF